VITKEHPSEQGEPYYPIETEDNKNKFKCYRELADMQSNLIVSGRLGEYKYLNMDQVIESALHMAKKEKELLRK
jgi:UDP-galactopyranose mutase